MLYVEKLQISRWRTFGDPVSFDFQYPKQGQSGPNLNIFVGRNNAGKSTAVQAFKMIVGDENIIISKSDRRTENGIHLEFILSDGQKITIEQSSSGAAHKRTGPRIEKLKIIDARRPWLPSATSLNRLEAAQFWQLSSGTRSNFDDRNDWTYQNAFALFGQIASDKTKKSRFDAALKEIFPFVNDWKLESDMGKHFIEYKSDADVWHSIALTGEGLTNAFMLIASLYDLTETDIVVVDEPELSLHPQAQRRLFNFLIKKSAHAQIIVSTHSPHFVTWDSLGAGIKIFRINPGANAKSGSISEATANELRNIAVTDFKNKRIFDALSRELFFSDKVVFVEGYEDVHLIEKFATENDVTNLEMFGYGAGGADNIEKWLQACKELGINAAAIYDKNKTSAAERARRRFPEFLIEVFPTDDIRDKPSRSFKTQDVKGMFSSSGDIKPEFQTYLLDLLKKLAA